MLACRQAVKSAFTIFPGLNHLCSPVDSGRHRHCLLDAVNSDSHFTFWLERIEATPGFYIDEVCADAQPYGLSEVETNSAIGFLKFRRDNLRQIIENHRSEFLGITAWSLAI